ALADAAHGSFTGSRSRLRSSWGSPEKLTEGRHAGGDITPSWSPDGKSLVFGEYPDSRMQTESSPIYAWLLDLQTRKLKPLPGSAGLFGTAWSPDGRYISAHSPERGLLVFDLATEKWVEIARSPVEWYAWSRNGRYIQYGSVENGEQILKRVRLSDHKVP